MIISWRRDSPAYSDLLALDPQYKVQANDDDCGPISWEQVREEFPWRVLPDAYLIDFYCQMVYVFEVEDHNRLGQDKLRIYQDINFEFLDTFGWGLGLISVDRWGSRRPISLFAYNFPDVATGKVEAAGWLAYHKLVDAAEGAATKLACASLSEWDLGAMKSSVATLRDDVDVLFWSCDATKDAYAKILRERSVRL
jgi:hypothetical protein